MQEEEDIDNLLNEDPSPMMHLTESTPSTSTALSRALVSQLTKVDIIAALTDMCQRDAFPIGAGIFDTLEYTIAGILALFYRANISTHETNTASILTCLYLLEQWSCSSMNIKYCCRRYTYLHPQRSPAFVDSLQLKIRDLQVEVLKRCNWSIYLDEYRDLRPAMAELHASPGFQFACKHIFSEAQRCSVQRVEYTPFSASSNGPFQASNTDNSLLLDPSPLVNKSNKNNYGGGDCGDDVWADENNNDSMKSGHGGGGSMMHSMTRRSQLYKRRRSTD